MKRVGFFNDLLNGVLMLGMTAAALMVILQQLIKTQRDEIIAAERHRFEHDGTTH